MEVVNTFETLVNWKITRLHIPDHSSICRWKFQFVFKRFAGICSSHEQLGSHSVDFSINTIFGHFSKKPWWESSSSFKKSDKDKWPFTGTPPCIFYVSLSSSQNEKCCRLSCRENQNSQLILHFSLSPYNECSIFPFGWLPDVWILCADVSEHPICSVFIGGGSSLHYLWRRNRQVGPKHRNINFKRREYHPKGSLLHILFIDRVSSVGIATR